MRWLLVGIMGFVLAGSLASAAPLLVPFDFSRGSVGVDVTVRGTPVFMFLDSGADPSLIDLARAETLGLKIDRKHGGEASGEGDAKSAVVYPGTIDRLAIAGHQFAPIDTLLMATSALSSTYGRRVDGVLGYSFLKDKIVLIDYANRKLGILDNPTEAEPFARTCRKHFSIPLNMLADDNIPVIPSFRFGNAKAPITLDTGSNGDISLYQNALKLPGVASALAAKGVAKSFGARGASISKTYALNLPIGFGPFALPAGQTIRLRDVKGSPTTSLANIGNRIYAAMGLKMLLDYRHRQMTFYGDCG